MVRQRTEYARNALPLFLALLRKIGMSRETRRNERKAPVKFELKLSTFRSNFYLFTKIFSDAPGVVRMHS